MSNEVGVGARTHPYPLWRADPPTCLCAKSRAPRGGWFAMNRLLAALAVLTFALVATGLYFWLRVPDAQAKAYTHMHCPECHMEMAYTKAFEGKKCPQCGADGPTLVPTVGKRIEGKTVSPTATAIAASTIALVIVQGGLYAWILFAAARRRAREAVKEAPLVCRCPFCNRKIGYSPKRVGECATCPRCKTAFLLPTEGIEVET